MAASGPRVPAQRSWRGVPAADVALLFTLVAMVSAAAAGYADYTDTDGRPRLVATMHSTLMTVALVRRDEAGTGYEARRVG